MFILSRGSPKTLKIIIAFFMDLKRPPEALRLAEFVVAIKFLVSKFSTSKLFEPF